jgi:GNAT superfamily N-acetyltransferase
MAREASTLAGRPLPPADDPAVLALLPDPDGATLVAWSADGRRLGAAWLLDHDPPLVAGLPELALAVVTEERGKGVGAALLEALAELASRRAPALTLNVHVLNPAVRLYVRAGFRVAGAGRGALGVAMIRSLDRRGEEERWSSE